MRTIDVTYIAIDEVELQHVISIRDEQTWRYVELLAFD